MSPVGMLHTGFAIVALLLGALVVGQPKGTRVHRAIGQVYALSMVGVNATAFMLYRLLGHFGPFHVAALVSIVTLVLGVTPAVLRRPRGTWLRYHAYFMSWSYVGLVAALAAETMVRLPLIRPIGVSFAIAVLGATLAVVALGAVIIARHVPRIAATLERAGHHESLTTEAGGAHGRSTERT